MAESETVEKRSVRVTLTAAQMATPEGAALLDLCKRVTADGEISDAEVEEIRAWVKANESAGVVGTAFLDKTLARHLADGELDQYERHELQTALERILPKKHRDAAIAARRAVELRRFKEAPEPVAEEPEDDAGGEVFDFMVAGVTYEGRAAVINEFVHPEGCAHLWRDKGNPYGANATAVRVSNGLMVGYVPKEDSEVMAPLLDQGYGWRAYFKKILDGRRGPIPVVVAVLTPPGAEVAAEPCCDSAIAFLRASNPKTGEEAVAVVNTFAGRITAEFKFAQPPTLNDAERAASLALDIRPTVRDFLARSEAARPLESGLEKIIESLESLGSSVRPGLEFIKANGADRDDRARAERLLKNLEALASTPVSGGTQAAEPSSSTPAAPLGSRGKAPADNSKWMLLGLGLVVAIAIAFAIIGTR